MRPYRLALLAVLGAALAVRVPRLQLDPLTSDEAFSWRLAGYPVVEMLERAARDVHPPLHYLLLKLWTALVGDSLWDLRLLAVAWGVTAVLIAYALVIQVSGGPPSQSAPGLERARAGALLAALLTALDAGQVAPSRNARMYSQGVVLVGLATWLLLRALRGGRRASRFWAAYALAAAACAATHYYALFSLAAHAIFVALELVRRARSGEPRRSLAVRFGAAAALAVLLFSPWLPVFLAQVLRVRDEYWIKAPTAGELASSLLTWSLGETGASRVPGGPGVWVALGAVTAAAAWGARRGGRPARFLLLQAATPWLLGVVVSMLSGRPVFLARYLVFAQVFWLAFWATVWTRVAVGTAPVALLALLLAGAPLPGLVGLVRSYPSGPSAEALSARLVAERHRPGDMVITDSARALNRLRLLLRDAGAGDVPVRRLAEADASLAAHFSHVPSLDVADTLASPSEARVRRVWWVAGQAPRPGLFDGWRTKTQQRFRGPGGTRHLVMVLERSAVPPAPAAPPDATSAARPR